MKQPLFSMEAVLFMAVLDLRIAYLRMIFMQLLSPSAVRRLRAFL